MKNTTPKQTHRDPMYVWKFGAVCSFFPVIDGSLEREKEPQQVKR